MVTLTNFTEKFIIQSIGSVVIKVSGSNYMNTADETTCLLKDWEGNR